MYFLKLLRSDLKFYTWITSISKGTWNNLFSQIDPVNEPGDVAHSEKNDDDTGGESETKSEPTTIKEKGNFLINYITLQ